MIGPTGAGKSTCANALIHGPDALEFNDEGKIIVKEGYDPMICEIGHEAVSKTGKPNLHMVKNMNNAYFVDCPGFFDNNLTVEFPNAFAIR